MSTIDTVDIKKRYTDLLIRQYKEKPKAKAMIELFVDIFLQNCIPLELQNAYDIATATGKQLDLIGNIVGLDRYYDGIRLEDEDFRFLLRFKIIINTSNGSEYSIDQALEVFFGDRIRLYSDDDMTMIYVVAENRLDITEIALRSKILPKPMAVRITYLINQDRPLFAYGKGLYLPSVFMRGYGRGLEEGEYLSSKTIIRY